MTREESDLLIVAGNPVESNKVRQEAPRASLVRGVRIIDLSKAVDLRGSLVTCEVGKNLPFDPKRFFIVFDVPSSEARGSHAHKECEQFLVCLNGSIRAAVGDGSQKEEFLLDRPDVGLYMPAKTWGTQYKFSRDAVLLVLASHLYDSEDYIKDYCEYLDLVKSIEK